MREESALPPRVAIIMATFDGARFIEEQIQSIQAQELEDWVLIVRDDGSADDSRGIVRRLAQSDPRIRILDDRGRLGAILNFERLLRAAVDDGAEYIFLSDQDDVWLPWKLSRFLEELRRLEAEHGAESPLLVHSDLTVVGQSLQALAPSFLARQGLRHELRDPLGVLLCQNFVTGCATALNRALAELALPFPADCAMHDWWLAQCAAAAGVIGFVETPSVLYRQHGSNQIGSGGRFENLSVLSEGGRKRLKRAWTLGTKALAQAGHLAMRLKERAPSAKVQAERALRFSSLLALVSVRRAVRLVQLGVRAQSPAWTAVVYAFCLLQPRRS